jgi:hypothetical protein
MSLQRWFTALVMVLGVMTMAACQAVTAQPAPDKPATPKLLEIEVAEDINRFVITADAFTEDGMPVHSAPFSTRGYIYPAGTINGTNGVLADGTSEFPDKVLGEWTCFGWMLVDSDGGVEVVSTQVLTFEGEAGDGMITTHGFEAMEVGAPIQRTISGGTGDFTKVSSQTQTLLGMTDQMAVNLGITFDLR